MKKPSSIKLKVQLPHKTTVEQVYVKRLQEQQAFLSKDEYKKRHTSFNKILTSQSQSTQKLAYYSHINEIRSIKEFLYISEKLKQKNIERKMMERLELKGKLNKIKEIEINKKLQYYLEKKIRLFLKETQHEEDPNARTFEAFFEQMKIDTKIMQFEQETLRTEFTKIAAQTSFHQERPKSHKVSIKKPQFGRQQTNTDMSQTVTEGKDEGTSKFLTMKVANKLLGLMMIEASKGKRVPILWEQNKKKELEGILNKPFGGKMHFDPRTFNWLIENTLSKSQAIMRKHDQPTIEKKNGQIIVSDAPFNHGEIQEQVDEGMKSIVKTLRFRPVSATNLHSRQDLKNRRVVSSQYQVSARIRENVTSQALRNQKMQEIDSKGETLFFQNDSYVNHYI